TATTAPVPTAIVPTAATATATPPAATVAPTAAPTATVSPTARNGVVTGCGPSLCLNGQPYQFTGLNIYNANSRDNCWYGLGSGTALDSSLADIGVGQNVFRAWFFQRLATTNGVRDWAAFDHTLAVAAARGQRVIVTLANQWGDCENATGDPVYKAESWYQSGYRSTVDSGSASTYREWVRDVVARYANHPAVLMWQLMNEAEARTSATGTCSSTAEASVHSWAVDVSGLVKSIDPSHLVSLGTIGNGQCGTSSGTSFQRLHAIPTVDICEYHDYDSPLAPLPGDQWNGLETRLSQCRTLGKPMFVGEMGVKVSGALTTAARAADLAAKFDSQFAAGVVGILPWTWAASGQDSGDGYSIGPNDPLLGLLSRY
ncbi:MAG: mannan endo,4-beta-mannosidase, partial [Chloroflexota bacterium]|nr:mannan endo,4-beta-mannosidase [Chloroflexota bacterium]